MSVLELNGFNMIELSDQQYNEQYDARLAEQLKLHVWGKKRILRTTAAQGTFRLTNRITREVIK